MWKDIIIILMIYIIIICIICIIFTRIRIKELKKRNGWLAVYKIISVRKILERGKRNNYVLFFTPMIFYNNNECFYSNINFIQYNKIIKNNANKVLMRQILSKDNEYKYEFVDIV